MFPPVLNTCFLVACDSWLTDTIVHLSTPAPVFHCNHTSFLVNNSKCVVCLFFFSLQTQPFTFLFSNPTTTACAPRNGKATSTKIAQKHEQTVPMPKLTNTTHQVKTATFWYAPTSPNSPDGVLAL